MATDEDDVVERGAMVFVIVAKDAVVVVVADVVDGSFGVVVAVTVFTLQHEGLFAVFDSERGGDWGGGAADATC